MAFYSTIANYSEIDGNWVAGGSLDTVAGESGRRSGQTARNGPGSRATQVLRSGPEKCVFIYNTNHNKFRNNWFERCGIGVHFTAGSEGNEITGNAFVGNRSQVKYVGMPRSRLVQRRARQLLERQSRVRPQWRRRRRNRLSPQRSGGSVLWIAPSSQGADQQPCGAGVAVGAGAVSSALSRRSRRQPSADRATAETVRRPEPAMRRRLFPSNGS